MNHNLVIFKEKSLIEASEKKYLETVTSLLDIVKNRGNKDIVEFLESQQTD